MYPRNKCIRDEKHLAGRGTASSRQLIVISRRASRFWCRHRRANYTAEEAWREIPVQGVHYACPIGGSIMIFFMESRKIPLVARALKLVSRTYLFTFSLGFCRFLSFVSHALFSSSRSNEVRRPRQCLDHSKYTILILLLYYNNNNNNNNDKLFIIENYTFFKYFAKNFGQSV